MNPFQALLKLEASTDFHLGRLLVLMTVFAGKENQSAIEGLTKLAKLDFFLRYPTYLQRAIEHRGGSAKSIAIYEDEKSSVESKMVRFRYGPWDFKYPRLINVMAAKGLLRIEPAGRTIVLRLTDRGFLLGNRLLLNKEFQTQAKRARALKSHLDLTATNLMKFVYDNFPEVANLKLGEEIAA